MNTNSYLINGKKFGWGPEVIQINPDKVKLLKDYAKGRCLDVGFGSGAYTKILSDLGHKVSGVDNQKSYVQYAGKKYPKIKFHHANVEKLPFKDKEFETVVAFDILEHVDDKKVIKEIFRVANRLIFSVPHQNQEILLRYGLSHAHYLDQTHLRVYTLKSAKKLFPKRKYNIVQLNNSLPLSISGLLVDRLSGEGFLKKLLLKTVLKPFLPEPPIFSTIFGIIEKRKKL